MPPRFSVFIATSLDGYIARPDGRLDWLALVRVPGETYGYEAFFESVDAMVIGRNTWDIVGSFPDWPYGGKRVILLTNRPAEATHGEEVFAGPVAALAARLDGARRVYVDGGEVVRQFLAAGLVSDITVSIIPVILGEGIRLFAGGEGEHRLTLVEQRAWPSGLVQVQYKVEP